jgi:non-specific serine/threonine protein kinase
LSSSVAALGVGPRDAPARQQTLADTVAWSVGLLDAGEREALARSSVFAGAFPLEAAETICGVELTSIAGLVDASLLQRTATGAESRFSMLETIREHAAALLNAAGNRLAVEQAHGDYYATIAESTPLKGSAEAPGLHRLDAEIDDLRTAHDRAVERGDDTTALRIATALNHYWYCRGLFREGRDRLVGPLDRGGDDPGLRAQALCALAGMHYLLGDDDLAYSAAGDGIALGRVSDRPEAVVGCHTVRGLIGVRRRDYAAARAEIEQSAAVGAAHGLRADAIVANTNLAEIALAAGDIEEARRRWEHTIEMNRTSGEGHDTFALLGLGEVARRQRRYDDAAGLFQAARQLAERLGAPHNIVMAVLGEASVASERGDAEEAGHLLGRVSAMATSTTGELHGIDADTYRESAAAVVAVVGTERFAELLQAGRTAYQTSVSAMTMPTEGSRR